MDDDKGSRPTASRSETVLLTYFRSNPGTAVIIVGLVILGILTLGSLLLPELFWDNFIWRYYWGPIAADAEDRTVDGISEGYNIVSTISYGIILAAAIFVIYRLILVLQIQLDKWFFMAVIPYIMFGGFARALEDAVLFRTPLVYIFISPLIYVVTGLAAVALMVTAHKISTSHDRDKKPKSKGNTGIAKPGWFIIIFTAVPLIIINFVFILFYLNPDWLNFQVNPAFTTASSAAGLIFVLAYMKRKTITKVPMPLIFGIFGLVLLSYPLTAVAVWYTSPADWVSVYSAANADALVEFRPGVIPLILGLSVLCTLIWAAAAKIISTRTKLRDAALFGTGTNLALVFGQFTDASATFIAIDYYNYWEKHVVPGFLIGVMDTGAVMFILKVAALVFAIYLLDYALREELDKHNQIVPLVKLAVLVLGLAPGTRDMLRLAMGV